MELNKLSTKYNIRILEKEDIDRIYDLCSENELFYKYHPPFVTKESILDDMQALPPDKEEKDKFYMGYFEGNTLTAVMDLILDCPKENVAYIGFFMMNKNCQGKGVGTQIINDCVKYLTELKFEKIRLAIDKGNPQSDAFWTKNGFTKTGQEIPHEDSYYLPMERVL